MKRGPRAMATLSLPPPPEHKPPSPHLPRLNEPAPDFEANTTHGPRKLADYRGRWLVLFSHPADFTPVCTTEFVAFAERAEEFKGMNCELLGLSVDSLYSHIAWMRNIEANFGIDVPFPVVDDTSMTVARAYGMIQPGESTTATIRSVFVIDPAGIVRAMVYYPLTTGRNVDEIARLVRALRTTDKHGVSTPEGWREGDDAIVPPPQTVAEAKARTGEGYECVDWYFCQAPPEKVSQKAATRAEPPASKR